MTARETNDGFQFYLRFAKPLVLNLASPKERVIAAAWVQKLKDEQFGTEKARTEHLKLLLFVLQKGKLFGPFVNNPGQHDKVEEFPLQMKLRDIAKSWVEGEENRKRRRIMEGLGSGDFPPLTTECSADLLEYVAAQDIPNFGVHAYYAISTEPINTWENLEKGIFPKGALSAVRKTESADASTAAGTRRPRSRSRSRSRSRAADDVDVTARERPSAAQVTFSEDIGDKAFPGKAKTVGKMSSPLGSPPPPARTTPTWGSNLISVGDPPSPEGMVFAPPKDVASGVDKAPSKTGTPAKFSPRAKLSFAEPKTSTPVVGLYLPTSRTDTSPVREAPSLPYQTPPWDMSAPSLPYQTPSGSRGWDMGQFDTTPVDLPQIPARLSFASPSPKHSTPILPTFYPPLPEGEVSDIFAEEAPSYLTDEDIMTTPPPATRARFEEAPSLPYQTPPWDMSAPSLPYQTPSGSRGWDMAQFDTTPVDLPQIPARLSFASPSPKHSTPVLPTFYPPLPEGEVSDIFGEEAPSFLADEDIMMTPPCATRGRFEEAPSLPYQTPPWDMSAPSVPYRTPDWDMSAPSIPYRTPEYDPFAAADAQYSALYDSPEAAAAAPAPPKPKRDPMIPRPSRLPRASKLPRRTMIPQPSSARPAPAAIEERPFAEQPDDFEAMERAFESESTKKSAAEEVQEILAQGIRASPAAQDIVDEAVQQMSMIGEEDVDMEQLYAERATTYPHMHRGMRTPPVFSRSQRIREAGRHIRYREPQFGVSEPVDWRSAEDVIPSETLSTSPREDLREKFRTRPFEELFPGVNVPIDYVPFDEDDEVELIDEELLVRSPKKRDLQRRIQDILGEIDRIEGEVPAASGVGLTTPTRSPSPVRPDRQDEYDDLFFYLEKPPEGFAMSPEDYMSPASKANAQYAALMEESPPRQRAPTPPRMETPEFVRKRFLDEELGIRSPSAEPEVRPRREKPPRTKSKKRKRKRDRSREEPGLVVEEEYESEEEITGVSGEEIEELYQSLVAEEEQPTVRPRTPPTRRPRTPPTTRPRTPTSPPLRMPPPVPHYSPEPIQRVHIEMPPQYDPYKTPPRRMTREEFPEALEYEEEPVFEEPWMTSPPTPPAPFEYESPQYTPLGESSPPIRELLEAHEFTEDFFDPQRPHMRKSVMLRGRRVPVQRHSRAPMLSPIPDHLEDIYASPPSGSEFERALAMAAQFAPPSPEEEPAAVCPSRAATPRAPKGVTKKASKGRVPKTTRSKTKLKGAAKVKAKTPPREPSPVAGPSRERTPPRPAAPEPIDRPILGPLTRKEHYYSQSFTDPKQRELMVRIERIIADVGPPPSPDRDEFEDIEGDVDLDVSPPQYGPPDEELPYLSPQPPPSPEPSPGQFGFESDISDFMTPPRAPSPRERQRTPDFEPFPFISPGASAEYDIFGTTPPLDLTPPSPARTPESPDIDPLIFQAEILGAMDPTYYDAMAVRTGRRVQMVRRHSRGPGVSRIHEIPETDEFEHLVPFHEQIAAAGPSRRRSVRAGTKKIRRRSVPPALGAISEHVHYPDSPITTRTPGTPPCLTPAAPHPRPVYEEGERLVDAPCGPCGTPEDTRPRPSRLKRKVKGRKLDFGPTPPRQAPAAVSEEEVDIYGPPPEDLMGVDYPIQYESREETIIDTAPPGHLPSPTLRPKFKLDWWETPPHLKRPPTPKKEFDMRLRPQLRDVLDYQSPIELPPSPEPLADEEELDFPLATAMGGFPATPPASPYEFSPSPKRVFGRQATPEYRRRTAEARPVTPPREVRPPAPGLLAAHRQYQSLLRDTPPEAGVCPGARRSPTPPRRASPAAGPSTRIETTSETVISPTGRRTSTKTKTVSPGPVTPPMMIMPPRLGDVFQDAPDVDLFSEEMPEFMEPSPEEQMRRGVIQAPLRTTRRPTQLYGYGERKAMRLERKQKPPRLGTVAEAAHEPRDEYVYWPGPHEQPRPPPVCTGGRLGVAVHPTSIPVSARGVRAGVPGLDTYQEVAPRRPKPREPPPTLSPPQIRRRQRIPRRAMTARTRLEFEQAESPKTYMEHLERLVEDVPAPEDFEVPQLPAPAYIEFEPPAWSPPPIMGLDRPHETGLDEEPPPEFEAYQSPRTPRESPGLPFADIDEGIDLYSPPIGMSDISPIHTPVGEFSPPPDMEGLDEFEMTPPGGSPPCGSPPCASPEGSPGELQRRVQEHEYTMHRGDTAKRHLTKHIHVRGRPYEVRKSQAPCLGRVEERPEPGYVREEQLLDITPPGRDPLADVMAAAARQYAMLMDSPEEERPGVVETRTTTEDYLLDEPLGMQAQMALPLPVTQEFQWDQWESPGRASPVKIPPRYAPPPPSSPERFGAMAPLDQSYMLDYMESPPLMSTPPRDIFSESMGMDWPDIEGEDASILTGSPARRSPPGGSPPCASGPCASSDRVSPDLMQRLRQHEYTEGFLDPRRPKAKKYVRSRENIVRLRRRAPSPPLEEVREVAEEAIRSAGARGLRPSIYPTAAPASAERASTSPYLPSPIRPVRTRPSPARLTTSPVQAEKRALPRRRLLFDESPPSPERSPEKVTTTETVTYDDPATGAPVTETTVSETVYTPSRAAARSPGTPRRTPKKSPCTPCGPTLSPREYDISGAFGGRMSPEILDTSDIPEDVDTEPFAWLDRR